MRYLNSIKKSFWSLAENASYPFLGLISTPLLLKFLGVDIFAQYIFVKTLVATGSIITITMSEAVTKEISMNLNNVEDKEKIFNSIKSSITITTLSILLITIIFFPICWKFFPILFSKIGNPETIHLILIFSVLLIYFEQIDGIFSGSLKGLNKFKISAILELVSRVITLSLCLYTAYFYKDLYKILQILVYCNFLRFSLKGLLLSRIVGRYIICFGWNKEIILSLLNFGKWHWIQLIGGTLESNGNRLILASVLGSEALTIYSVLNSLSQIIFLVPSASLYWIFPKASKLSTNNKYIPKSFYKKSIIANILISLPTGFFMIAIGKQIISLWIGIDFATENYLFFILISISWTILSFYVATHYLLLGFGKEKLLGLINIYGGILSVIVTYLGITIFGIYGIIFGKFALIISLFKQVPTSKNLLKNDLSF